MSHDTTEVKAGKPLLDLKHLLQRLEREKFGDLPQRRIAEALGINYETYNRLRNGTVSPTVDQIITLATHLRVPVSSFFDRGEKSVWLTRDRIRWKVSGRCYSRRERSFRIAGDGLLNGRSVEQIAQEIRTLRQGEDSSLESADIGWMAQSAYRLGLVRIDLSPNALEVLDDRMGEALETRLEEDAKRAGAAHCRFYVVKNLCHESFDRDYAAHFTIARLAHRVVAEKLKRSAYTVGISGGSHLSAFVTTVDAQSSFVPDAPGSDRRITLVPLTLEPFSRHDYLLADALVGELAWRASSLISPERVTAQSFKPTGFLVNRRPGVLETDSVVLVRDHYMHLDVAIFGCGSLELHGWATEAMQAQGVTPQKDYVTDVCLNPLDAQGRPLDLLAPADAEGIHREYLGVNLQELRAVSADDRKLSLMLTSGEHKGEAIISVARSGAANAIICDRRAAACALNILETGSPEPAN